MAQCITCGSELHPDRATRYDYCMAPACQEKNLKGLTMVAIGVNKAAEAYLLLDERTRDELASGMFRDQRRGSFGTSLPSSGPVAGAGLPRSASRPRRPGSRPSSGDPTRIAWAPQAAVSRPAVHAAAISSATCRAAASRHYPGSRSPNDPKAR